MKLPDSIRIGPIPFAVSEDLPLGGEIGGRIEHDTQTIKLRPGMGAHETAVILWHEIVHGIKVAAGDSEVHDEGEVHRMATLILQVLIDNPQLDKMHRGLR